jgi:ComF family protein
MEKNLWGKMPIEKASAFLHYSKGGDVRRVLYELKYYGNKELGKMMGACMAREIQSSGFFRGIDGIIPVPLHPERERQRGYNQSEWIARGISEVTGIPVWEQIIVRSHFVSSQTHKSNLGRWESMQGQFRCLNKNKLIGKHILLVDDVMTTGATLVAVADSVQGVDDIKFSVLTLALAGQD